MFLIVFRTEKTAGKIEFLSGFGILLQKRLSGVAGHVERLSGKQGITQWTSGYQDIRLSGHQVTRATLASAGILIP
jgi:hypothetical protein